MKPQLFLLAFVLCLLLADTFADKVRKHKKYVRRHRTTTTTESDAEALQGVEDEDVFSVLAQDEEAEPQVKEEVKKAPEEEEEEPQQSEDNEVIAIDPCAEKHCGAGQVCEVNEQGEGHCVCIPDCPVETDPRRKVCSNHNETWGSDCEVYQMRCWCKRGMDGCRGEEYSHIHIEYYGLCRDMPNCTTDEKADFPRRMRDWLFNIMRDFADRRELTPHYLAMEREAENNMTRRWTNAAIWKWCDLDGHPHDRSVSRHELFPIRAPLMSLEHCIAPFLDSCDTDNDHLISLVEWGKCLELDQDDLDERCDEIREG